MSKILVTISGYYERFQINTIESCLKRAKNPENISFAIAHHEDHIVDTSHLPVRVSRYIIPKGDKTGIQKPKHILANMLNDEDFILSIDSHVIMMPEWDIELVNDYNDRVANSENKNIIISGNFGNSMKLGGLDYNFCLSEYFNNDIFFNEKLKNEMEEYIVDGDNSRFTYDGDWYEKMLNMVPYLTHGNGNNIRHLSNIYSGNFSFFPRSWFEKGYNFSKEMFFSADQTETAMNIYTSGYDIWMPRMKYHIHMTDHDPNMSHVSTVLDGKKYYANRYFDMDKDRKAILWFLDRINYGYNDNRIRTVDMFFEFFKLTKGKYLR